MIKIAFIAATIAISLVAPLAAQESASDYDFRERIRVLAFDPDRFFPERVEPAMSVRYLGDGHAVND